MATDKIKEKDELVYLRNLIEQTEEQLQKLQERHRKLTGQSYKPFI